MDESISNLPTSHLPGSVPAVVKDDKKATNREDPRANLQIFPPNSSGSRGQGYQTPGGSNDGAGQQPTNTWKGVFSIQSYTQYFNVDTDIVLNRLISSLFPMSGDFFSKIDASPDLYGLVWVSTMLVFTIAMFGNFATYLMNRRNDQSSSYVFDVNYVNVASISIYGYAMAYYFLLQYMGSSASLFLLVIPVEFLRWIIILISGVASGSIVSFNLRSYIQSHEMIL